MIKSQGPAILSIKKFQVNKGKDALESSIPTQPSSAIESLKRGVVLGQDYPLIVPL